MVGMATKQTGMNFLGLGAILVLVAVAAAWWWSHTPEQSDPSSAGKPQQDTPVAVGPAVPVNLAPLEAQWQRLENAPGEVVKADAITFTVTEGDQKKWDVLVDRAIYYEDQTGAHLKGLKGRFYNASGQPTAEFVAPYGEYDQQKDRFEMRGGVTVKTVAQAAATRQMALQAPTVIWSSGEPFIQANGGVVVQAGQFAQTNAQRAQFSLDMSTIQLQGGTATTIQQP